MRLNDRTDADGNKVLFVEELQSDWGQVARKEGTGEKLKSGWRMAEQEPGFFLLMREGYSLPRAHGTREEVMKAADRMDAVIKGVPKAPFVTNTEDWVNLSLKRLITNAVNEGYDKVAFINGQQSADRYKLSKYVNSIAVPRINTDGTRLVRINAPSESFSMGVDKDGVVKGYYDATPFTGKKLNEVVGKEMAAKIMEVTDPKEFSGLNLQIGGEGMKGFYDNILPKSLEKLGKKFDAKVGKTEMDGVEVWQMDITPKMRESVVTKGQPLFAIPAIGTGLLGAGMMQEEQTY
jgi:hypothetical protein